MPPPRPLNPFEQQAQQHVANPGADISPAEITQAGEDQRRAGNLVEWKRAMDAAKDPAARNILLQELKRGSGVDFPLIAGMDRIDLAYTEAGLAPDAGNTVRQILGQGSVPVYESESGKALFSILGGRPDASMPPAEPASLAAPGERSELSTGAVTGRTNVPAERQPLGGPATQEDKTMLRMGVETGGAFLGGGAGAYFGGVSGMRAGEGAGAFLGSLLSETFDPTKAPLNEAVKTGAITLGTGLIATGLTGAARALVGKPSEGGRVLIDLMAAHGKVPLPGTVLESEFMKDAQSFGSAAFGTKELLNTALASGERITTKAANDYVSGFQRYHDGAKLLFREVDNDLARVRVPTQPQFHGGTPSNFTGAASVPGSGAKFSIKGDIAIRDALDDVISGYVRKTGRVDAMPSGLQKMHAWQNGGPEPRFTFEETQQIYDALFDKAAALEFAARSTATQDATGVEKKVAEYVREQAKRAKNAFDESMDFAISSGALSADTKTKLLGARQAWSLWTEGKEMSRMVSAATVDTAADAAGNGARSILKGSKLLNEIDRLVKLDKNVGGRPTLSPDQVKNLRNYALAAQTLEASEKQGAYVLSGRAGQVVGMAGMFTGTLALPSALLTLAPHVIAASFSRPELSALLIRGLKLEPGSAAAVRLGREIVSIWEKEKLIGADHGDGSLSNVSGTPQFNPRFDQRPPSEQTALPRG